MGNVWRCGGKLPYIFNLGNGRREEKTFDVEYIYGFVMLGGL